MRIIGNRADSCLPPTQQFFINDLFWTQHWDGAALAVRATDSLLAAAAPVKTVPFTQACSSVGRLCISCWGCNSEAAGSSHYLSVLCNPVQEERDYVYVWSAFCLAEHSGEVYSGILLSLFMIHVYVHVQTAADYTFSLAKVPSSQPSLLPLEKT